MEAANARVLAFGASVGVLSAVSRGFKELVTTTIEVEKSLASINSILGTTSSQLNKFKQEIFEVARNTEQSFSSVANAALELSRQGLKADEVTRRSYQSTKRFFSFKPFVWIGCNGSRCGINCCDKLF